MTKITDALSQETDFAYDEIGNLTGMTDDKDNFTKFDYEFGSSCGGCGGTGSVVTKITRVRSTHWTLTSSFLS